jgi:hypothetical protein
VRYQKVPIVTRRRSNTSKHLRVRSHEMRRTTQDKKAKVVPAQSCAMIAVANNVVTHPARAYFLACEVFAIQRMENFQGKNSLASQGNFTDRNLNGFGWRRTRENLVSFQDCEPSEHENCNQQTYRYVWRGANGPKHQRPHKENS